MNKVKLSNYYPVNDISARFTTFVTNIISSKGLNCLDVEFANIVNVIVGSESSNPLGSKRTVALASALRLSGFPRVHATTVLLNRLQITAPLAPPTPRYVTLD